MSLINTLTGRNQIQEELNIFTYPKTSIDNKLDEVVENIDTALQTALDKVIDEQGGIQYEPKSLADTSIARPNQTDVDMNNKRLLNVATLPGLTIDDIMATPQVGVNVTTMSNYTTASLALNTAYCGPLFSTMNVKGKKITNASDPDLIVVSDPSLADKNKQVVTQKFMNDNSITTAPQDRLNFYSGNKRLYSLGDALIYKDSDIRTIPNPIEPGVFDIDQALWAKYLSQGCNLKTVQNATVALEDINRNFFQAQFKQIKKGAQATDPKDFVTLDQVVHEEIKELEWAETDPIPATKTAKYITEPDRVFVVANPRAPTGGQFLIKNSSPPSLISEEKQVANLKFCRDEANKKHSKTADVDLNNTYKVINMPNPSANHHGVNKSYCDSNSGKDTGGTGGNIFSTLFGAIAGAVAGTLTSLSTQGIGSALGTLANAGVSAMGSFAGNLFNGGMRVGSTTDLNNMKLTNPIANEGALIDNLKSDIANRPQGQPDAGSLVSGAMSVTGLFRAVRNAQVGLFDLVPT